LVSEFITNSFNNKYGQPKLNNVLTTGVGELSVRFRVMALRVSKLFSATGGAF